MFEAGREHRLHRFTQGAPVIPRYPAGEIEQLGRQVGIAQAFYRSGFGNFGAAGQLDDDAAEEAFTEGYFYPASGKYRVCQSFRDFVGEQFVQR